MPHVQGFYVSKGNAKVQYPIITMGPALECASRKWCPFDGDNHKASGRRRCYAQVTERFRPSVLVSRQRNAAIIASKGADPAFICRIVSKLKTLAADKIVRFNEAGDLSSENIEFAVALAIECRLQGLRLYGYSKAPMRLIKRMRAAGATVLQSERDFVAVPSADEGEKTGLAQCEGICGPCSRCPDGERSWIIEH